MPQCNHSSQLETANIIILIAADHVNHRSQISNIEASCFKLSVLISSSFKITEDAGKDDSVRQHKKMHSVLVSLILLSRKVYFQEVKTESLGVNIDS